MVRLRVRARSPSRGCAADAGTGGWALAAVRFDVPVAVRLDIGNVRDAVLPAVFDEAEALIADGRLGDIGEYGGGAVGVVQPDGCPPCRVWAGVVDRRFVARCGCAGDPGELCVHAVALTVGALRDGFAWSSAATPPSAATWLGPPTDAELTAIRAAVDGLAVAAMSGEWQLSDLVDAGWRIVDEVELLVERPLNLDALDVIEHAVRVWDGCIVQVTAGWRLVGTESAEIGDQLRGCHVAACSELDLDVDTVIERVITVIRDAEAGSCLDAPDDYLPALGPAGVADLHQLR